MGKIRENYELETFTKEYQYSDDSDVLESFEIVLLVMQHRGIAHVGRRIERDNGSTELRILLFGNVRPDESF